MGTTIVFDINKTVKQACFVLPITDSLWFQLTSCILHVKYALHLLRRIE